ncbi:MAG: hypothetical protein M3Z02_00560 [Actinomycetota bacterium]|nr:hypothetical protein [Actinomycetota bacterium]
MNLSGPFGVTAALLVLAGAPKVWRPQYAALALRQVLPVPGADLLVRALGLVETLLGCYSLARGGRVAALLVAASYVGFSAFVLVVRRRGGALSTCGCFGRPDTPATLLHVAITAAAAVVAAAAAALGVAGLPSALSAQPMFGLPFAGLLALSLWLGYLALTALPRSPSAAVVSAPRQFGART